MTAILTSDLYQEAIRRIHETILLDRTTKQNNPQPFIVATHGPALLQAIIDDPTILDMIGIYRVNCSHIGKEIDLPAHAQFLRAIHPSVPVLIDLQGPKPRIHEMSEEIQDKMIMRIGDTFEVTYAPNNSNERFCTYGHIKVCFPEIVSVMEVGDVCVFDDGKMTAIVRGKSTGKATLECTEIPEEAAKYILKGKKGICVRNKPLGVPCVTYHDRKSIEFAQNILGFEFVDNVMVSYFTKREDVEDFAKIIREEYSYKGPLGGKFETPHAVLGIDEILATKLLSLAMFGRGDLRVEMDPRAVPNMHRIQSHFFAACKKYNVESICATGFLESMIPAGGKIVPEEIGDMQISMRTGPDHLMLSGESTYGAQPRKSIELECLYQRDTFEKLQKNEVTPLLPEGNLGELLFIS